MTIIEIQVRPDGGHGLQSQSGRESCWLDGWIAVPQELEETAWACKGYCTLDIQDGVLTGITPGTPPEPEPVGSEETQGEAGGTAEMQAELDALEAAIERGLSL